VEDLVDSVVKPKPSAVKAPPKKLMSSDFVKVVNDNSRPFFGSNGVILSDAEGVVSVAEWQSHQSLRRI